MINGVETGVMGVEVVVGDGAGSVEMGVVVCEIVTGNVNTALYGSGALPGFTEPFINNNVTDNFGNSISKLFDIASIMYSTGLT
ncbi:MAG: hypothetical protein QXP02_03880 [Desulfurococcaceae archaeon]